MSLEHFKLLENLLEIVDKDLELFHCDTLQYPPISTNMKESIFVDPIEFMDTLKLFVIDDPKEFIAEEYLLSPIELQQPPIIDV